MKYLNKFNEAIIDYKGDNIEGFYKGIKELLDKNKRSFFYEVPLKDAIKVGEKNGIEVVNYDTFYNDLPERDKKTAPPRDMPAFALVNSITLKPRVVLKGGIGKRDIDFIHHMLKHENIHVKQHERRPNYKKGLPDPNNKGGYFGDYDEVMAYAQSIVDQIMDQNPKTIEEGISKLPTIRLYVDIKNEVNEITLKKYRKYIYLYLEKELEPKNNTTNMKTNKTKKELESSNSLNEAVSNKIERYQKLFDEAYSKKDKGKCEEYDKILIDLYGKNQD